MSSKKFTALTFQWLYQIKDDHAHLPPKSMLAAVEFTTRFNENEEGAAWPSYKTLGAAIGTSEHTAIRIVRAMVARGHLRVDWGTPGRGHPNRYWMVVKPAQAQVLEPEKPANGQGLKPAKRSNKTCKALQENHLKNHSETVRTVSEGESPRACARETTLIGSAGAADQEENEETRKRVAEGWETLRRIWVRPWPDDAAAVEEAEESYIAACSEIAPEDLAVAAEAWAGAVDNPRFLPPLSKWLAGRGWDKPPPQRKPQRQNGHRYGRKPDLAEIALLQGGALEDPVTGQFYWPDDEVSQ